MVCLEYNAIVDVVRFRIELNLGDASLNLIRVTRRVARRVRNIAELSSSVLGVPIRSFPSIIMTILLNVNSMKRF